MATTPTTAVWGPGAARACAMGEGDPASWLREGLRPLDSATRARLGPAEALAVAAHAHAGDAPHIGRVVGGICVHRSGGCATRLPVSTLWDIAALLLVARALDADALVLPPIAQEITRDPAHAAGYRALGRRLGPALHRFGRELGVTVRCHWSEAPDVPAADAIDRTRLYGLFTPFATAAELCTYPFGRPDEARILDAHASYCLRYRAIPGGLCAHDLVSEALPIARSVLLGIEGTGASYLATVPLPAMNREDACMTDAPPVPTIETPLRPRRDWWPERVLAGILGVGLEGLRRRLLAALADAGAPQDDSPDDWPDDWPDDSLASARGGAAGAAS